MPGVFSDIELTYKGQAYTFQPTIRAMRRIEQSEEVSLSRMVMQATTGAFPMFEIACVYAAMLREAGCKGADEDAVFVEMSKSGGEDNGGMSAYLNVIVMAISPPEMDEKKADAPAEAES